MAQAGAAELTQQHVVLLDPKKQQQLGLLRRGLHQAGKGRLARPWLSEAMASRRTTKSMGPLC